MVLLHCNVIFSLSITMRVKGQKKKKHKTSQQHYSLQYSTAVWEVAYRFYCILIRVHSLVMYCIHIYIYTYIIQYVQWPMRHCLVLDRGPYSTLLLLTTTTVLLTPFKDISLSTTIDLSLVSVMFSPLTQLFSSL